MCFDWAKIDFLRRRKKKDLMGVKHYFCALCFPNKKLSCLGRFPIWSKWVYKIKGSPVHKFWSQTDVQTLAAHKDLLITLGLELLQGKHDAVDIGNFKIRYPAQCHDIFTSITGLLGQILPKSWALEAIFWLAGLLSHILLKKSASNCWKGCIVFQTSLGGPLEN